MEGTHFGWGKVVVQFGGSSAFEMVGIEPKDRPRPGAQLNEWTLLVSIPQGPAGCRVQRQAQERADGRNGAGAAQHAAA